jgi:rod shape-determining protein MreD
MPARSPLVRRLMAIAAGIAPIVIALFCVILGVLPTSVPGLATMGPALTLMAVYYWSIFAPLLLPPPAVFVVGLVQDVLGGGPIGLNAFVLLAVHGLLVNQRRVFIARAFPMAWFGFAMVALGAAALSWAIASAFYMGLLAPEPFLVQAVLSVALYPIASWAFSRVHLDPAFRG